MIKVKVPASSANMGPGFDCMGVALDLHNEVCIEEIDAKGVEVVVLDESRTFLPTDERNYVYASMERVFREVGVRFGGYRITIDNSIPVTRGLGSSSAGIVAGLAGANYILKGALPVDELLNIACQIEGHPDNVAPALLGGFVVSFVADGKVHYIKTDVADSINFGAMIPDFYFRTKKSRSVLPKYVSHKNAVYNVSHASFVAASFMKGDFSGLGAAMKDRLHQNSRIPLIKDGEYIMRLCRRSGADACYLSGAGPTIMSIIEGDTQYFCNKINRALAGKIRDWHLHMYKAMLLLRCPWRHIPQYRCRYF